ncbi:NAD-dependent epimerase/dehydratase family protein [Natronosalvus halobius]|uniref:NAD-dependent epimerase/dehydratase family protein n=1 Tax=Natronosalvus halobius TaxID=2953746 RepID=UPI00209DC4AF|nr:NAD(P)H-binding protein [Natronosalvus halobius]USZ70343.1 NAD(P)H-binding protein [Natronosalvus halobius]
MRIAITGGTGFVGSHLARRLGDDGHDLVLIARGVDERNVDLLERENVEFVPAAVTDERTLREAFVDCEAVAHLAGINHERGAQTYEAVHVDGTRNVVEAATDAGVSKLLLTSYLRARPDCGWAYHQSKWEAERIVRRSRLEYTVVKPGVVYGPGDRMLWGIARSLATVPVFPRVGLGERRIRPVAIEDLVDVLAASIVEDRLSETTVAVTGPEELTVAELVKRVGDAIGRNPIVVPAPVRAHLVSAWAQERILETPVVTTAGVRMLAEEATEPAPKAVCDPLPEVLEPTRPCSRRRIEAGLPQLEPFGVGDLRWP